MEQIKTILANKQLDYQGHGNDAREQDSQSFEDSPTSKLAEILKTGHQTRKFSNTPTLSWLQTWRVSNLAPCDSQ